MVIDGATISAPSRAHFEIIVSDVLNQNNTYDSWFPRAFVLEDYLNTNFEQRNCHCAQGALIDAPSTAQSRTSRMTTLEAPCDTLLSSRALLPVYYIPWFVVLYLFIHHTTCSTCKHTFDQEPLADQVDEKLYRRFSGSLVTESTGKKQYYSSYLTSSVIESWSFMYKSNGSDRGMRAIWSTQSLFTNNSIVCRHSAIIKLETILSFSVKNQYFCRITPMSRQ